MKECTSDITLMLEVSSLASKTLVKSQKEGAQGNVYTYKSFRTGDVHTHRIQRQHVTFQTIYKQWESKEQYMDASGD